MLELRDLAGRRTGAYRAGFNGTDLGATAAAPVIRRENRERTLAVFAGGTAGMLGEVRLTGPPVWTVTLTLVSLPLLLAAAAAAPGTLTLTPVYGGGSGSWSFTGCRLLPGWELHLPDREPHTVTATFRGGTAVYQPPA